MKRLLFFLLSFAAVIPTNAQIREYKGDLINQFKRDAFKYREEIRESLKDSLLAHGAAPALHSIWVDRGGFIALNLDGKPFLPGVEYDWISSEISPGVYIVSRRTRYPEVFLLYPSVRSFLTYVLSHQHRIGIAVISLSRIIVPKPLLFIKSDRAFVIRGHFKEQCLYPFAS